MVRVLVDSHALDVARRLLGATLCVRGVRVRITEVEAYGGVGEDPGSHAFRGPGKKNATMFGPPGRLYVYFTYGMHWCANVVCGPEGSASAVLLRAGEVVDGIEAARARRLTAKRDADLARGPARLTQALGLSGDDDDADLTPDPRSRSVSRSGSLAVPRSICLDLPEPSMGALPRAGTRAPIDGSADGGANGGANGRADGGAALGYLTGPRTGVSGAGGTSAFPWRFWLPGEPSVSPYRPHVPKRR